MTSTVTIVGNLTRDPEMRYPTNSQPNATFGVAVNRRWQRQSGDWVEDTSFFNVIAWAGLAENVAQSLKRGDRVLVEGRLDQHSWETAEGERRSRVEIVAEEVGASVRFATVEIAKIDRRSLQTVPADADAGASADEGEPF
jgi:single-strand DNA-binding protein